MKLFFLTIWVLSTLLILTLGLLPGSMSGQVTRAIFDHPPAVVAEAPVDAVQQAESEGDPVPAQSSFFDRHYYGIQWWGHVAFFAINCACLLGILGISWSSVFIVFIWASLIGAGVEWGQGHLPASFGRTGMDWKDLAANYLGMGLAMVFMKCVNWKVR